MLLQVLKWAFIIKGPMLDPFYMINFHQGLQWRSLTQLIMQNFCRGLALCNLPPESFVFGKKWYLTAQSICLKGDKKGGSSVSWRVERTTGWGIAQGGIMCFPENSERFCNKQIHKLDICLFKLRVQTLSIVRKILIKHLLECVELPCSKVMGLIPQGPGPFCVGSACFPRVCMGPLQGLWLPPTFQRQAH